MQAAVWLVEPVVAGHQEELARQAVAFQAGRIARRARRRPGTRRERLGWMLVELGLRLALPAGERPGVTFG